MLEIAIDYDYCELMKYVLYDSDEVIDLQYLIKKAVQKGSPKMIKMLLNYEIGSASAQRKEEIENILRALQKARKKDKNEKSHRSTLLELLPGSSQREMESTPIVKSREQHPIYILLVDCKVSFEEILEHCMKLELCEPMVTWIGQNFFNLSEALLWSCEKGYVKLTSHLLEQAESLDIDPSFKNQRNQTCFHRACQYGNYETVLLLLVESDTKGIDINAVDSDGHTGFSIALSNGHQQIVNVMINESLSRQINLDINDKQRGNTLFHFSCSKGFLENVEFLLKESEKLGIDLNVLNNNKDNGFTLALQKGYTQITDILLKETTKIQINSVNHTNGVGDNILHSACWGGNLNYTEKMLKKFKDQKMDINSKNFDGKTALHISCQQGHQKIAELLQKQDGIDIATKDSFDNTCLHLACLSNNEKLISPLLNHNKIDLIAQNINGNTCFHTTSMIGNAKIMSILLGKAKEHNVDIENNNHETPLSISLSTCHYDVAMVLIKEMEERKLDLNKIFVEVCNCSTTSFPQRRKDIVEYLLKNPSIDKNAAINANVDTMFHIASNYRFKLNG